MNYKQNYFQSMFNKYSSIAKKTWQRTDNTIALKNDSKHTSQNMDQTRRLNAVSYGGHCY